MIELSLVENIEKISKYAYKIDFRNAEMAKKVQVGQFVHIKLSNEFSLRRPISICDVVSDIITIIFEVRGKGTQWLSNIKKGDELSILGPRGKGFDLSKAGENPMFIGGGIGVPPLLYSAKNVKNSTAILGFRNSDFVMLEDEFKKVCKEVIITTDDGSYGMHGFVTDALKDQIKNATTVYACGPTPMLKAIYKICEENNVACEVSLEERMACGVGACLVCACEVYATTQGLPVKKYKHVCKDGPVFNAREVF
ncbi:MAG: dihydroorotate dehydrogenase electron transfer subunit [Clostridia bacterium]